MQLIDGTLIVSATDLVGFLECDHLVTLETGARPRRGREAVPRRPAARAPPEARLRPRAAYLARLRGGGPHRRRDRRDGDADDACRAARGPGRDARGDAGRRPTSSSRRRSSTAAGAATRTSSSAGTIGRRTSATWSYDVADTKLARRVKAAAIVQMCVYADLLEQAPGHPARDDRRRDRRPRARMRTGSPTTPPTTGRRKARFEARVFDPAAATSRRPTRSRSTTAGSARGGRCASTVGAPTTTSRSSRASPASQPAAARRRGRDTLAALAELGDDAEVAKLSTRGSSSGSAARPRSSSSYRRDARPALRADPAQPDDVRARASPRCREPSPLDVFFDIEADPWALDDGLEYLFGWAEIVRTASRSTTPIWAHDRAGEKADASRRSSTSSWSASPATRGCTSTTTAATSRARSSG